MSVQVSIIRGIGELLHKQDFIVLPDFGGFVLKANPARFSEGGKQLLPPGKTVSFNAHLKQNDGVLNTFLQKELGCDLDTANKHLKEFAGYCSMVLQAKRRISLEGIGFFYLDFEGNTCFEPQRDLNYLPESFGLQALALQALPETTEVPLREKALVFEDRPAVSSAKRVSRFKIKATLVSGLILLLLATVLLLLVSERKMTGQLQAALGIPSSSTSYVSVPYPALKIQSPTALANKYIVDANGIALVQLNEQKAIAVIVDATKYSVADLSNAGNYEIVFGCFEKASNAKRLISKLKGFGFKARVSEHLHKGMQVVCSAKYVSREDATNALEKIRANQPHAWLRASN